MNAEHERAERWLQARFGLSLTTYPPARAEEVVRKLHEVAPESWDSLQGQLALALSIPETHFARHPECFEALRTYLVRLREAGRTSVRLWSAGCASGEEAWQLAAVGREVFGSEVRVFATDFSSDAVARAEAGVYGSWSMRGPQAQRLGWLHRTPDGGARVDDSLRPFVQFEVAPLLESATREVDVVFCRNVLIYFSEDGANRILERLASALLAHGLLFMSPTDPRPSLLRGWPELTDLGTSTPVRAYRPPHGSARIARTTAPAHDTVTGDFADTIRRMLAT